MSARNDRFDLVVLGSGPAGASVATRCAEAGWSVAVIEAREPGGTCALRGCNPKKVLVHAAELVDRARRSHGKLGRFPDASICWPELVAFEREFTDDVPEHTAEGFEARGIRLYEAAGRFLEPTAVAAGDERLEAGQVLIATGSRPATLPFPGAELVATSDDFLTLSELPERIVFVGGGFISFELAHVAARAGARVTIVEREERALAGFEADLVARLVERSRALGIDVLLDTEVSACRRTGPGLVVGLSGSASELPADLVVHGGGRVPNLDGLDLEAGQVAYSERGVDVDEHLRSPTNDRVLAAGDCVDSEAGALTPVASAHAHAIALNLLDGEPEDRVRPDLEGVPRVVYTVPPLAGVGPTEARARELGLELHVEQGDMSGWNSVRRVSEPCAAYKLLVTPDGERLLAAHLVGPGAAETINLFALALRAGLSPGDLKSAPLAFPTFGHDVRAMV